MPTPAPTERPTARPVPTAPAVLSGVLSGVRRGHTALFWTAVGAGGLAVAAAVGLVVDDRVLLGAPLWLKPLKFAASFAVYAAALAWMLSLVGGGRRTGAALGWVVALGSAAELAIIFGQAARGVRSHFNTDTDADSLLFSVMGLTVALIWLATAWLAVGVLRRPGVAPPVTAAIRWGLLVALLGMLVGVVMSVHGGHAVAVADGGPGLPVFGWSTVGGDLRVAHFVGLHALQVLPLVAALLAAVRRLPAPARSRLVHLAGAAYLALIGLLTWQALRGQPLTAPDATSLAVLGGLLVAVVAGATVIVGRARGVPVRG